MRQRRSCDSGQQTAPAHTDQYGLDFWALLENLQATGPLPGDDVRVVERVDEDSAGLGLELLCPHQTFVNAGAELLDVGAIGTRGVELGNRRAQRHEYRRLDAE